MCGSGAVGLAGIEAHPVLEFDALARLERSTFVAVTPIDVEQARILAGGIDAVQAQDVLEADGRAWNLVGAGVDLDGEILVVRRLFVLGVHGESSQSGWIEMHPSGERVERVLGACDNRCLVQATAQLEHYVINIPWSCDHPCCLWSRLYHR